MKGHRQFLWKCSYLRIFEKLQPAQFYKVNELITLRTLIKIAKNDFSKTSRNFSEL